VSLTTKSGEEVPVRVSGAKLRENSHSIGKAYFLGDRRPFKQLEREKIDAERLAAVGQTVAGLAHGIKNILTGLEGGMYVVESGLKRGKKDRIDQGWGMLQRNIGRISALVKNLLNFSKGRMPEVALVSPPKIAQLVVDLYADAAEKDGILITADVDASVADAPMDAQAIQTCLENLVSNALDACQVSQKPDCRVTVRCREESGTLMLEVADEGCGMDYDVKQKAFTSFFTTKGAGGTGLGLLLTRKIVQEHGGKITLESTHGEGSTFRLSFPRNRLPEPPDSDSSELQMEPML
jgi:signal transduction histidine kinase